MEKVKQKRIHLIQNQHKYVYQLPLVGIYLVLIHLVHVVFSLNNCIDELSFFKALSCRKYHPNSTLIILIHHCSHQFTFTIGKGLFKLNPKTNSISIHSCRFLLYLFPFLTISCHSLVQFCINTRQRYAILQNTINSQLISRQ